MSRGGQIRESKNLAKMIIIIIALLKIKFANYKLREKTQNQKIEIRENTRLTVCQSFKKDVSQARFKMAAMFQDGHQLAKVTILVAILWLYQSMFENCFNTGT